MPNPSSGSGRQSKPKSGAARRPGRPSPAGLKPVTQTGLPPISPSPGRGATGSEGRRGSVATGSGKGRSPGFRRGIGLRAKFMSVLSVITAAAMIVLGVAMAHTANKYLFSLKQHDGLQMAKLCAQLADTAADQLDVLKGEEDQLDSFNLNARDKQKKRSEIDGRRKEVIAHFEKLLGGAQEWSGISDAGDILAVQLNCPDRYTMLSQKGWGEIDDADTDVQMRYNQLFIPKLGATYNLPSGQMEVFDGIKNLRNQATVPIYRFKVRLPARFGGSADETEWLRVPHIRVDIDARAVDAAKRNLFIAIAIGVLLTIGAVIGVANWLAGNITRPLSLLIGDMQVVARGNLHHETVPHSTDEIGVLAQEFNRMTTNLAAAQGALVEQEKQAYELSIAREVQKQMLPLDATTTAYPDGGAYYAFAKVASCSCGAYYKGAKAVSGDYFDAIEMGNGLWGFCVADVSGKGIPGSMVMAVTRTIVRLVALKHQTRAAETLKETNRLIARQIKRGMFVTCFYAVYDERTGQLTYASAGHNPMAIYRAGTRAYELATGKGIALGFNEGPIFDRTIEVHQTVLQPGDGFVLYTDGFPEAMNAKNEEFGDERFYALVAKHGTLDAQQFISALVGEVAKHRGEAEQSDDLTIMWVRRN